MSNPLRSACVRCEFAVLGEDVVMFSKRPCALSGRWSSRRSVVSHARYFTATLNVRSPVEVDAKWQTRWARDTGQPPDASRQKSYVLPMFAYPSGSLHMGHLRVYTISDVIARHRRMKGYEVLHPTGWDAFGLPAENAAIERGVDPAVWTLTNIEKMKLQLRSMNTHFDWHAEISTCSPSFYKHTQSLFCALYNHGLAYRDEALVNWDPVDQTVLANEQVDSNGRSWRSGAVVEQKVLKQWFFRITQFQQDLLHDLDVLALDSMWPERVLQQQRNWIGQSWGARIQFGLQTDNGMQHVNVFTTRPDTLCGVKFIALAFSHPLVQRLATANAELRAFLDRKASFETDSKAGFRLPVEAINPLAGISQEFSGPLPVYVAPYVLDGYGDEAVMGVPAHDSRDLAFWKQHQPTGTVPIVVLADKTSDVKLEVVATDQQEAYTGDGILSDLCGPYAGLHSLEGAQKMVQDLASLGKAEVKDTWRLKDWLISRQRYWGTPIPIIHCPTCGTVPVPEADLPVELPSLDPALRGRPGNPLERCEDWVNTNCPKCGSAAKRETDTMDTFVDSSWYYLRFPDAHHTSMFSAETLRNSLPVDTYVGGVEHAILHLLYARFIYKFLCSPDMYNHPRQPYEPFRQLIAQGMVHGKTFSDPENGRFLKPDEVDSSGPEPVIKASGKTPNVSWEKMSKSKYNGVDPSICIAKYGADATRAHILFAAPVSEVLQWDEEKIVGIQRWFQRLSRLIDEATSAPRSQDETQDLSAISDLDAETLLLTQATLRSVNHTLEHNIYGLNTYISNLIKLTNALHDAQLPNLTPGVAQRCVEALVKMLAPVAPAFAEECWERLSSISSGSAAENATTDQTSSIFRTAWPSPLLTAEQETTLKSRRRTMTCAVQVNGKLRLTAQVPVQGSKTGGGDDGTDGPSSQEHEQAVIDAVLQTAEGKLWLTERNDWQKRKKVIVVKGGQLINVVF